jgi:hypothetical protein
VGDAKSSPGDAESYRWVIAGGAERGGVWFRSVREHQPGWARRCRGRRGGVVLAARCACANPTSLHHVHAEPTPPPSLVLTLTAAKQVVGPGLGRDPAVLKTAAEIIRRARAVNLPLVIDADGLHVVTTQPELVRGYEVSTVGVQEASAGGACVACFATLHPALNPTLR